MVTEIRNSEQPMTTYYNIFIELLQKGGSSIAGAGGGLAVILTYTADLAQWVAIVGGALGLIAGVLGVYSKIQEIRLKEREMIFKNLQIIEFQKTAERDNALYESSQKAIEHSISPKRA